MSTVDTLTMQPSATPRLMLGKLEALRTELVEFAFTLERQGSREAADVAMTVSARVRDLCDEFETEGEVGETSVNCSNDVRMEAVRSLNR